MIPVFSGKMSESFMVFAEPNGIMTAWIARRFFCAIKFSIGNLPAILGRQKLGFDKGMVGSE